MNCRRIRVLLGILAGALGAFSARPARAQAWLPPQGEAWISAGYGNAFFSKHYLGVVNYSGTEDVGHIRTNSIAMALGYAVTDRFTLDVGIPYVISKYWAPPPPATPSRPWVPMKEICKSVWA